MFHCSLRTQQYFCFSQNTGRLEDNHPCGFPRSAPQLLLDPVVDRSLKASCPFKSFISITQQVQWHTSNKQLEKENCQGWVEPARRRNQTPTDRQALWSESSLWLRCKHTYTQVHMHTCTCIASYTLAHKQPQWQKRKKKKIGLAWSLIRTCKGCGGLLQWKSK